MSGHRNRTWALMVALGLTLCTALQPADAWAVCNGCGGNGGQLVPCYTAGQVVYDWTGDVFGTQIIYRDLVIALGPCLFRSIVTRVSDGAVIWDISYSAGCPCAGPDASYNVVTHPAFDIPVMSVTGTHVVMQTPQGLSGVKVVNVATGATVFTMGPVSESGAISVPRTVLPNGDYIVEGFVASGRLDGSTVLRVGAGGVTTGKRQVTWSEPDGSGYPVRTLALLYPGVARIALQRPDNSIEMVTGTSSVAVPGLPRAAMPLVGAGLLLSAGLVIWRRRESVLAA